MLLRSYATRCAEILQAHASKEAFWGMQSILQQGSRIGFMHHSPGLIVMYDNR